MISISESESSRPVAQAYQLKAVLAGSKPAIWRRFVVPGDANLGWLHAVLQVGMGWTNSHLHIFTIEGRLYTAQDHELGGDELDEDDATLARVVPAKRGHTFEYLYDFGDSWSHEIVVERVAKTAATKFAVCLDGARACPPEDCGGVWGYHDLLKTLKKPSHPEHESMKEWLGRPWDARAFDLDTTNHWLRKLKWPRATEGQLRKILMGRDNANY